MKRHALLLLSILLLSGCTEVTTQGGTTTLSYSWSFLLCTASPGIALLTILAAVSFLLRRRKPEEAVEASLVELSEAEEESSDELLPEGATPGRSGLKMCLFGCAILAGILLLLPALLFLYYGVEVHTGGPLVISELPTTHTLARESVRSVDSVGGGGFSSRRLQISTQDGSVYYVNESEIGEESFEAIQEAVFTWWRDEAIADSIAGEDSATGEDPSDPTAVEPSNDLPAADEPAVPVRDVDSSVDAGALGDARFALKAVWGDGRLQHAGPVSCLAVGPNGKRVYTAGAEAALHEWDLESGVLLRSLRGHRHWVECLAISPDGKRALTSSRAAETILWNLEDGTASRALEQGGSVAFLGDGQRAWVAGLEWDLVTDEVRPFGSKEAAEGVPSPGPPPSPPDSFDAWNAGEALPPFAAAGRCLAWGDRVYDAKTGEVIQVHASGGGLAIALSPDGNWAASGGETTALEVYEVAAAPSPNEDGEPLYEPASNIIVGRFLRTQALAFSPNGMLLAAGDRDRVVRVFEVESGQLKHRLAGHSGSVTCLAFTPDGKRLVSSGTDGSLRVWDLSTGKEASRLSGHRGAVTALALGAKGSALLSGGEDHTVRLWRVGSGSQRRVLRGHTWQVSAVAFLDARTALTAGLDGKLKRWDLSSGRETWGEALGNGIQILDIAVLDPKTAFLGRNDPRIQRWDAQGGLERAKRVNPPEYGAILDLSARGGELAVAGPDAAHRCTLASNSWASFDERALAVELTDRGLLLALDGQADSVVLVRRDAAGKELGRWETVLPRHNPYCVFSPDGRRAFVGGRSGEGFTVAGGHEVAFQVWDLTQGELVQRIDLSSSSDYVTAVSVAGDTAVLGTARGRLLRYELE